MLLELGLDQARGQGGRVDGHDHVELLQEVGKTADVILVAVRDVDAPEVLLILQHDRVVRKDQVDSEHLLGGEGEATVENQEVRAGADGPHVLPDFAGPSEGQYLNVLQIKPPQGPS
ncbi:hypothetical protein D3C87_787860 [compost metagenome]